MDAPEPTYVFRATLSRAVDGDTAICDVDLGFYVSRTVDVRIRGLDAPELRAPGGAEARAHLEGLLGGPTPFTLRSHKTTAGTPARSFERWVADVWCTDGRNVADAMIAAGYGVPEGDS